MLPAVSVVIATKNRPQYLERLLTCVRDQDQSDLECIVLDDGSDAASLAAYDAIWRKLDDRFTLVLREDRQAGGPSKARNRGIALARGTYVAFCDDDDRWIRSDHLSTALRVMQNHGADLFFAAMQTGANGEIIDPDLYAPARTTLQYHLCQDEADVFEIPTSLMSRLLRHRTLHTDTIIAARALLIEAGLYWEKTNLAEDRDFSFRLTDRARKILFRSTPCAELEVSPHTSLYRSFAMREKALWSYLATLHSELEVRDPTLRQLCRAVRAWDLLDLARNAQGDGNRYLARRFARESFWLHPSFSALRFLILGSLPAG